MGLLLLEPITASLQIVPDSCLWGFWCVILCRSDFLLAASTEGWGNEDISFLEGDWLEQPSCPVISTVWLLAWDRTPWIIKAAAIRKMSCMEMSRNVRLSRITTPCVKYLVISESNNAMFYWIKTKIFECSIKNLWNVGQTQCWRWNWQI